MENTLKPKRLLSLDILRGITIAGMIMVNNPGTWGSIYAPLKHASWNGLTPTDLVFPFFMFIMGVSMYISLNKNNFEFSSGYFFKLLKRSILIFLIGTAIGYFSMFMSNAWNIASDVPLAQRLHTGLSEDGIFQLFGVKLMNLRALGVMQRLALSSFFASLLVVLIPRSKWLLTAGIILVGYYFILFFGNGFELSADNIIARVDVALWGESHMYKEWLADGTRLAFDPEGLLSTLPCIAHVILGVYLGRLIMKKNDMSQKISEMFIFGTILLFAGFLFEYLMPINKKLWTSTFVLTTCGLASQLLALLTWVIDVKGKKKWSVFFESFGINPLFMYVTGGVLAIIIGNIRFYSDEKVVTLKGYIYDALVWAVNDKIFASFLFAVLFVLLNWVISHWLYKRKIYIKL